MQSNFNIARLKKIKTGFFLYFFLIYSVSDAQDSTSFEIQFTDGYKEVVTFDYTSIDSCFKNNFTFDFINIGLYFGNQEPEPLGTFITNFDYHFYPGDNNQFFYGNLYVPILDGARMLEPNVEDLKTFRVYFEAGYARKFAGRTKEKEKRLNFYNKDRQVAGYDYTIHMAKLPIIYQSKWMYRAGFGLHQRGIDRFAENEYIETTDAIIKAGNERSLILQAGISKSNYYRLNYHSEGFGDQKASIINHIYFDLLMAPLIKVQGEKEYLDGTTEIGEFSELDLLDRNLFGWRFGIKYQGSSIRAKSTGASAGIEFGLIPGLANGGGYLLLKYGMGFHWN